MLNCRTIPTRVGKTVRGGVSAQQQADHPHAGGENAKSSKNKVEVIGPSPRGWGKHGRQFFR